MNHSPIKSAVFLALLMLVLAAAIIRPVQAQTPGPSDDEVNSIAKELYCPVCENIPLDVCGTPACKEWRDLIRVKLSEGWTQAEIKEYFAVQYGDRVLAEPPARGLNWLIYVVPPLFFLAAAILVGRVLYTSRKPKSALQTTAAPRPPAEDPYIARLEQELRERSQKKD